MRVDYERLPLSEILVRDVFFFLVGQLKGIVFQPEHLASNSEELRPDILVVGAGAIGVAAAYALAERGAGVLVVEARDAPGAECSHGNAGLISPSHCIPLAAPGLLRRVPGWLRPGGAVYVKPRLSLALARFGMELARNCNRGQMIVGLRTLRDLARTSRDLFEQHVRDGLEFGYRRDGLMNVCISERAFNTLLEDVELLRREGLEPEVLGPDEARKREPSLRPDISSESSGPRTPTASLAFLLPRWRAPRSGAASVSSSGWGSPG